MAESSITTHPLSAAWLVLGRRLAAAGGAFCALLSLFFDAPVWVASLRGAAVWLALRWLVRLCAHAAVASIGTESDHTPPNPQA